MNHLSLWLLGGGALTVLAALSRLWPFVQRVLWERMAPSWRPWLTTVPAVLGCVAAIVATPSAWLDHVEALLVVLTPLLAPGALPAGAQHSAPAVIPEDPAPPTIKSVEPPMFPPPSDPPPPNASQR